MTDAGAGPGAGAGGGRGADSGPGAAPGADAGADGAADRPAAPRRRGRPPRAESAETRDRILAAAREQFSERGYDKTSVRGIAKAAGVDSALVHHYFGTKDLIFEAAVEGVVGPVLDGPGSIAEGPLEGVGEQMARFFFGVWENHATRAPLLAIVRSAVNNDQAAAVFRRLVAAQVLRRIAARLDLPDAELRAELAAAQLIGCVMLRYVIKVEPLASADVESIIERLAPVVQGHLTGP
ncbi:TetR family transcriptional regulator [Streptomyces antibioticus]|uniref:TetR/AcrR family transcriptional regulator n=1 Tax=Streptomyces antibioticus TaxID=1890 RepID=UPI0036CBC91A